MEGYMYLGSQKILTASDQFFLSYVKNYRGGQIDPPPPAGIGFKVYKVLCTVNSKQMYSVQLTQCIPDSLRKYYVQRAVNRCTVYSLHTVY